MTQHSNSALLELEASILGGILLKPDILGELPAIEVDDFRDLRHRVVFSAMRQVEAKGVPIDVVTIEAEIERTHGHSDQIGGFAFLGELALRVPTVSNVHEYARQVREASLSRRVFGALEGVMQRAMRDELHGAAVLTDALAALSRIDAEQPDTSMSIDEVLRQRFKQLDQIAADRISGKRTLTGFPTGIASLDEKIGGVQAGIVTGVGARPGMGKSSLGLAIADASSAAGFGVHVFSLEDAQAPYADRTLSRSSLVPADSMRNVRLNRGEMGDITRAAANLRRRPWLCDFRSGITADEIVRTVRRHRRENGTRVVIVDYIQLVKRPPGMQRASTHEVLKENMDILADAAKQDDMAYVVMSQLNRELEKRQDKRPMQADFRESGSLEERPKCLLAIYRGSFYGPPVKGIDWDPQWEGHRYEPSPAEHAAQAQVIVLKQNNGPSPATAFAQWNGPTTRME